MDEERTIELSPEQTALIIVDMQAEGCERHGPGLKPVIKNIRSLLDRFREANGKIIHIQSVRPKDHPEFTFYGKPYSLLDNSPAVEFVEELKPYPNEIVIKKYSHDCFYRRPWKNSSRSSTSALAGTMSSSRESARIIASITPSSAFTSETTGSTFRRIVFTPAELKASNLP